MPVSQVVLVVKNPPANAGDIRDAGSIPRSHPWFGKIPWRRKKQPSPGFLLGESHGQRSLVDYSSRGHKESDTTEQFSPHACDLKGALPASSRAALLGAVHGGQARAAHFAEGTADPRTGDRSALTEMDGDALLSAACPLSRPRVCLCVSCFLPLQMSLLRAFPVNGPHTTWPSADGFFHEHRVSKVPPGRGGGV